MAEKFQEKRIILSQINGGYRYETGDGVTPDTFNAPIEGLAYVQKALSLIIPAEVLDNVGALGATYRAFSEISYHSQSPIYANIQYTRTGVGIGTLRIDFAINKDSTLTDSFQILSLSKIKSAMSAQKLNIEFINNERGGCIPVSLNGISAGLFGYAMYCVSDTSNGHISIGRYYTASGDTGAWQFSLLAGNGYSIELKVKEV